MTKPARIEGFNAFYDDQRPVEIKFREAVDWAFLFAIYIVSNGEKDADVSKKDAAMYVFTELLNANARLSERGLMENV